MTGDAGALIHVEAVSVAYPIPGGVVSRYNNYRNTLTTNPCRA